MTASNTTYNEGMPTIAAPRKRLSRPEAPRAFRITVRDKIILSIIARYRFLTSHQIARVAGGSPQKILRRLQLLFYHAYIDRPEQQHSHLAAFFDEGNRPLVYGLSRKGAQLLSELGMDIDPRLDWTTKNARATAPFLAHTIEVAETMLAFQSACSPVGSLQLIDHHDLLPFMPQATQALADPFCIRVSLMHERKDITIGVIPDRLLAIAFPANRTRLNFALELDRGTMDVKSKRLVGKSSFRRKQIGYFNLWKQNLHTSAWAFQGFRVLTITPSEKRLQHMLASQHEVTRGSAAGLFMYSTPERIASHGILGPAWITSKEEGVSLVTA